MGQSESIMGPTQIKEQRQDFKFDKKGHQSIHRNTFIPKIQNMKYMDIHSDISYGDTKLMKTTDGIVYAVKQQLFTEQYTWNQYNSQMEQIKNNEQNEFLVQLLSLQHDSGDSLCSFNTNTYSVYQYYPYNLSKDMQELIAVHKMYKEIEIVALLFCVTNALISLKSINCHHGDLRLSTILMTSPSVKNVLGDSKPNPIYKITNIQEITHYNAYQRHLLQTNNGQTLLLSPEQLSHIQKGNLQPSYDAYKSDIFSLGLAALQMALQKDLINLYDFDSITFLTSKMDDYLQDLSEYYSQDLCDIIRILLTISAIERPDSTNVQTLLKRYDSQLDEYIHHYLVENDFTLEHVKANNYKKQVNSINDPILIPTKQNQHEQSTVNKLEQSNKQSKQNQNNRFPKQFEQLNQNKFQQYTNDSLLINQLDEKVQQAVERSHQVQKLCLNSPIKEFKQRQSHKETVSYNSKQSENQGTGLENSQSIINNKFNQWQPQPAPITLQLNQVSSKNLSPLHQDAGIMTGRSAQNLKPIQDQNILVRQNQVDNIQTLQLNNYLSLQQSQQQEFQQQYSFLKNNNNYLKITLTEKKKSNSSNRKNSKEKQYDYNLSDRSFQAIQNKFNGNNQSKNKQTQNQIQKVGSSSLTTPSQKAVSLNQSMKSDKKNATISLDAAAIISKTSEIKQSKSNTKFSSTTNKLSNPSRNLYNTAGSNQGSVPKTSKNKNSSKLRNQ